MKQTAKEKTIEENRREASRRLAALDPQRLSRMQPARQEQGRGRPEQQSMQTRRKDRELEAER